MTDHTGIADWLHLVPLIVGYGVMLVACGGLVTRRVFPRSSTLFERLAIRCILGTAVLPIVVIAGHELFGVKVRFGVALMVSICGGVVVLGDERRRWNAGPLRWQQVGGGNELLVGLLSLGVALSCFVGAARYPMFEGRDPWGHLLGVRYVIETGSLRQPFADWPLLHYIDGYPPLYDVFLALPSSLAHSLNLSAKASNAMLVGLVNVAVFLLVRRLSRSSTMAMMATAVLVVLPGSLTRQIWGHSLAILLTFTGLLGAVRCRASPRWIVPTAVAFGGALLAAPTQGIKAGVLLLATAAVSVVISRRWAGRLVVAGSLALLLAMVWFLPLLVRVGVSPRAVFSSMDHPTLRRMDVRWEREEGSRLQGLGSALLGSGHSDINLDDFLFFRPFDFMRRWFPDKALGNVVPQGFGAAVSALVGLFLLSTPWRWRRHGRWRLRPSWRDLLLAWLAVTLLGVLGRHLGVGFYVWRFWMLLCPVVAMVAAERLVTLGRAWPSNAAARVALLGVMIVAIAHAVICFAFPGEPLLWKFFRLNSPFLLVVLAIVLWLGLAHAGSRLGLANRAFAVVAVTLVAHVLVATPVRLRALTAFVKPSIFLDPIEYTGYAGLLEKTPPGAMVFPLSDDDHSSAVIALDRVCRPWNRPEQALRRRMLVDHSPPSPHELVVWLKAHGFSYAIADPSFGRLLVTWLGRDAAQNYLRDLVGDPGVQLILSATSEPPRRPSRFYLLRIR